MLGSVARGIRAQEPDTRGGLTSSSSFSVAPAGYADARVSCRVVEEAEVTVDGRAWGQRSIDFSSSSVDDVGMVATVPISELSRQVTKVTELAAEQDVILSRRGEAEDLYLSTRERHEREVQAQLITTGMLASLARTRPDIAGEVMMENLSWMAWLPASGKIECLQELITDLRAGAQTGDLSRFSLDVASWQSTAVAYNDPEALADLRREHVSTAMTALTPHHPSTTGQASSDPSH